MRKTNVIFLDIDDCLIVTSSLRTSQIHTIRNTLQSLQILHAQEITSLYVELFSLLFSQHQVKNLRAERLKLIDTFIQRMTQLEQPVVDTYAEIKKWSREVFLYIAAERAGVRLTSHQIRVTIDALWNNIAETTEFYPDAKEFLNYLQTHKIPFYLISASDGRLTLDDTSQLFHYDPEYSREEKYRRLKPFIDMGISREHIFLGDPIDKPDPYVFKEALKKATTEHGHSRSIMIGDSISNDLLPASQTGMDELIWINRGKIKTVSVPAHIREIQSFNELLEQNSEDDVKK